MRTNNINILGRSFTVTYTDRGMEDSGEMVGPDSYIRICTKENRTDDAVESTLLHERIHAAFEVSGLNKILESLAGGEDEGTAVEEAICNMLENALAPHYQRKDLFHGS